MRLGRQPGTIACVAEPLRAPAPPTGRPSLEPVAAAPRRPRWRRWALRLAAGGVLLLALAQAVPYGRSHANPPVQAEPKWNSPATRTLAERACFDCHSNLTSWPLYSSVAPVSWLVQRDVDGGRSALNFSEWNLPQDGAGDAVEAVAGGSMPPWFYTIMHPKAKLSAADEQALMNGLAATLRNSPPLGGGG
jgi:hypothetical protein